jgi:Domain of unknown function (DUF4760)
MQRTHFIDELLRPPVVIFVIWIIAGTIVLHVVLGDSGKKDVDFGAAILSGAGIVYTVLLTVQSKRASSAARFAERWNDRSFTAGRAPVGQVIRGEKTLSEINTRDVAIVLNFFEEMSISIQTGEAQEEMLRKFFRSPVVQSADALGPWIRERQKAQPSAFEQYLKLVERWRED